MVGSVREMTEHPAARLLGCLLLDPHADVGELRLMHFEHASHRAVFDAIRRLRSDGVPVDLATVTELLRQRGELERVGGAATLAAFTSGVLASQARFFADSIRASSSRRELEKIIKAARESLERGEDVNRIRSEMALNLTLSDRADPTRARFSFSHIADIPATSHDWLIDGYLERGALASLFADPNVGKTFLALDWACSIGSGVSWCGFPTKRGVVFYVLAEGQRGIKRRADAWHVEHNLPMSHTLAMVSMRAASLVDDASMREVSEAIEFAAEEHGDPALIVFDTSARNLGGADENSTQDTNTAIVAADRLRERFNASVLFIHHTGHAAKDRARGASALRGALDHEYRMERDEAGVIRFECVKMKDAAYPAPLAFELHEVEVGRTEHGEAITSAVLRQTEYTAPEPRGKVGRGKWQTIAITVLESEIKRHEENLSVAGYDPTSARVSVDAWRIACTEKGIDRRRFSEVKSSLLRSHLIREDYGYVFINH